MTKRQSTIGWSELQLNIAKDRKRPLPRGGEVRSGPSCQIPQVLGMAAIETVTGPSCDIGSPRCVEPRASGWHASCVLGTDNAV